MKKGLWLPCVLMCTASSIAIAQSSPSNDGGGTGDANENNAQLAEKLSNPVAALISAPFQFNYDNSIGLTIFVILFSSSRLCMRSS